jgi:plasmid stability protein
MPLMLLYKHHKHPNMSIRTTVTLDDDVAARVRQESKARGTSFRDTLNELLRLALLGTDQKPARRTLVIQPRQMGFRAGLRHDSVESLLEYGEGEQHR